MKNTRTEYLSTANYKSCNIQVMGIPKGEETERRRNIWNILTVAENFDDTHQIENPGSSENTMQANSKKSTHGHIIGTAENQRQRNSWRKPEEINTLPVDTG